MGAEKQEPRLLTKGREVQPNKRSRDIMTEVTKEDREALERIDDALGFLMDNEREQVLNAFARHREASTEALQTEVAALRTALRRIESAEYINSLQGTANFERLQQIARAALQESADD